MKNKSLGLIALVVTFAASALAQNQISGTSKCKPDGSPQSIDIGDRKGHQFLMMKLSCTFNVLPELAGLKGISYSAVLATEQTGAKFQEHGYVVMKMDNGDTAYGRTQDAGSFNEQSVFTAEGTWQYTGGTGKLKGLKGKGTFKASGPASGDSDNQMEGEYSLPEATITSKKK